MLIFQLLIIEYLQEFRLLKSEMNCHRCSSKMAIKTSFIIFTSYIIYIYLFIYLRLDGASQVKKQ